MLHMHDTFLQLVKDCRCRACLRSQAALRYVVNSEVAMPFQIALKQPQEVASDADVQVLVSSVQGFYFRETKLTCRAAHNDRGLHCSSCSLKHLQLKIVYTMNVNLMAEYEGICTGGKGFHGS